MRILLVDDEGLARRSIRSKLNALGYEDVLEAENGLEALTLTETHRPELIIADIRMPVLDGIGMLAELRKRGDETFVVILSGYDLFAYAREAMKYNTCAYLLKPVDDDEFVQVIQKIENRVEMTRARDKLEYERQRKLQQGETALRQQFLSDLVFQRKTNRRYVNQKMHELFPEFICPELIVAVFRVNAPDEALPMEPGLLLYGIENIAAEMLEAEGIRCSYFIEKRDLILVCCIDPIRWPEDLALQMLLRHIKDVCRKTFVPDIILGVGLSTSHFDELYTSYIRALRVVERQVAELVDAKQNSRYQPRSALTPEREELLLRNLALPDRPAVLEIIDTQFCPYIDGLCDESTLPSLCLQLILLFERALAEGMDEKPDDMAGDEFLLYQQVTSLGSPAEMNRWMRDKAIACMDALVRNRREASHVLIYQARQYIHEHYREQLTLEQVAEEIHLSPSYFSSLFRKHTDTTFINYLVDIRLSQAKRLLLDPSKRVSEIGGLVGFRDMRHFYKVFKKQTGLTPSEYRERSGG